MSDEVFAVLKELASWASGIALALIAWAWKHNAEEHKMLAAQIKENADKAAALRQHTSDGYSTLNDRIMEHVDAAMADVKDEQRRRTDKLADHIEKLFHNAEIDRKEFFKNISDHREESYKRHIELLHAINTKADK